MADLEQSKNTDKLAESGAPKKMRKLDWRANHAAIEDAVLACIKEDGKWPSTKVISIMTEIPVSTIEKHLRELDFQEIREESRALGPAIMKRFAQYTYAKPTAQNVALYLKTNYDWHERQDVNLNVSSGRYVGRRLKELSDDEFKKAKAEYEAGRLTLRDGIIIEAEYKDNDGDNTTRPA